MEQLREVQTDYGLIRYVLIKKRVKNLNLRLLPDGTITLSVPLRCTVADADRFVQEKSDWIISRLERRSQCQPAQLLPELSRRECYLLLEAALHRVYPLVQPMGVRMPELRIRVMRSQWGNCHWAQGYITLNTALHRCPEHLRDYVALHELVHFLHHDHSPAFYAVLSALMPDWKARRTELKCYGHAIRT